MALLCEAKASVVATDANAPRRPPNLGGEFNGRGQLLYYCHSFYNAFSLFRTIHFGCRCASIALLMRIGSADDEHRPRERWASASKIYYFNREKRIVVFRNSHLRILVNDLLPSPLRFASFHYTRTRVWIIVRFYLPRLYNSPSSLPLIKLCFKMVYLLGND